LDFFLALSDKRVVFFLEKMAPINNPLFPRVTSPGSPRNLSQNVKSNSVPSEDPKDCTFCKIISGQLPCIKVFENDEILAFLGKLHKIFLIYLTLH
jgi:hypothetical protein